MIERDIGDDLLLERKKARAEGKLEGVLQGRQEALLYQLERRFGKDCAHRDLVMACADPDKLLLALEVILEASAADAVLACLIP